MFGGQAAAEATVAATMTETLTARELLATSGALPGWLRRVRGENDAAVAATRRTSWAEVKVEGVSLIEGLAQAVLLGLGAWLAISALGGAVAGAIYYPEMKYWYVGVAPGLLSGPSVLLATYLYLLPRESVWTIELVIPLLLALLPWGTAYYFALRSLVLREAEKETSP